MMACSMDEYAKEKRTEKNLIVRSGHRSMAVVYLKPKLYRHEASCGVFATAELLVFLNQ